MDPQLFDSPVLPRVEKAVLARPVHVSGYAREGRDFYATPAWVTEALLAHIKLRGPVWEPCCGTGAMSRVIEAAGYQVHSTDIADRGYGQTGVNFLACKTVPDYYVEDCVLIGESPAGSQIGRAVMAAAWQFRVRPARIGGREQFGSWVRIRIDYTLRQAPR